MAREVSDPGSQAFFGGTRFASAVEIPEPGVTYYSIQDVPHGQVREVWYRLDGHRVVASRAGLSTARLRRADEDALSRALPAAWRRRGRDRLDPPGPRQRHPRQPDRRRAGEADDRRDGVRLRAPRRRGCPTPRRSHSVRPRCCKAMQEMAAGLRRRRDAGADPVRRRDVPDAERIATIARWRVCPWAACRPSRSR